MTGDPQRVTFLSPILSLCEQHLDFDVDFLTITQYCIEKVLMWVNKSDISFFAKGKKTLVPNRGFLHTSFLICNKL